MRVERERSFSRKDEKALKEIVLQILFHGLFQIKLNFISSIPRLLFVKDVFCFLLLQELNISMRGLINIQNVDNECFR